PGSVTGLVYDRPEPRLLPDRSQARHRLAAEPQVSPRNQQNRRTLQDSCSRPYNSMAAVGQNETEGPQEVIMRTGALILFGAFVLSTTQPVVLGEGSVTFTKDVAPILYRSCQNCHRPGS